MVDWDDFGYEPEVEREADAYEASAVVTLDRFFEENDANVFFGNQLAVQNERTFFHWITHRAIAHLIGAGLLLSETRQLSSGSSIKLVWNRRYRYYKRDAKRVTDIVEEYGSPMMCEAIGLNGEQLVLEGFARREFVMRGRHTRRYRDAEWTETNHNLDFIFERDGRAYGIEVKNTLSYMPQEEFRIKIRLCKHLGIIPVFAARMLPKSWVSDLIAAGGYAMIMGYQLYPWTHAALAKRVARELNLPVDAPKALADGTMTKFETWHVRNV